MKYFPHSHLLHCGVLCLFFWMSSQGRARITSRLNTMFLLCYLTTEVLPAALISVRKPLTLLRNVQSHKHRIYLYQGFQSSSHKCLYLCEQLPTVTLCVKLFTYLSAYLSAKPHTKKPKQAKQKNQTNQNTINTINKEQWNHHFCQN